MGLEHVELTMKLEEVLGIDISDEDAYTFSTVGDVMDYINLKIYKDDAKGKEKAFSIIKNILMESFDVLEEEITEQTHFVDDLGFG